VESDFQQKIDQLVNREITEFTVMKEEFMEFRMLLVKREDFKHFRGTAKHNGEIVYQYLDEPRS
jgi:hypothetical protein